jgi:hypothetical protein
MYELFSRVSNILSGPFLNMARSMEGIPILFAFLLGIVGALAPCQFTGNLGAITIYGQKSLQKEIAWAEIFYFRKNGCFHLPWACFLAFRERDKVVAYCLFSVV